VEAAPHGGPGQAQAAATQGSRREERGWRPGRAASRPGLYTRTCPRLSRRWPPPAFRRPPVVGGKPGGQASSSCPGSPPGLGSYKYSVSEWTVCEIVFSRKPWAVYCLHIEIVIISRLFYRDVYCVMYLC
jgi:hypothetical protein